MSEEYNKKERTLDIDWAAMVDLFASEYGWSIDDIKKLDMSQIVALARQIRKRYADQAASIKNTETVEGQTSPYSKEEMPISDFVTKMGGKMTTDEDGTKRIVL